MIHLPKIWFFPVIFGFVLICIYLFVGNTASSSTPDRIFRVGLQVGHWKADRLPEELKKIRQSSGAEDGGKLEWEINLAITQKVAYLLEKQGIKVDILPATIPPGYTADAFVAIHADQNPNSEFSGFKTASAFNNAASDGVRLSRYIEAEYQKITKMSLDDKITLAMTRYYAFNSRKFKHSVSPETPAVIVETGFLSNAKDRQLLINYPEISAKGISSGIVRFLRSSYSESENVMI